MTAGEFTQIIDPDKPFPDSWAEYEFKAAVYGIRTDRDFCRWMLALTRLWSPMVSVVAEGILSSIVWECFRSDIALIADICELFTSGKKPQACSMPSGNIRRMADEISACMADVCCKDPPLDEYKYLNDRTRKYTLLDAAERRFPLLPVKYYAANARSIHTSDERLAVWIKQRLSKRAVGSEAFRKIYESMAAEFVNNHLASAVFMK